MGGDIMCIDLCITAALSNDCAQPGGRCGDQGRVVGVVIPCSQGHSQPHHSQAGDARVELLLPLT